MEKENKGQESNEQTKQPIYLDIKKEIVDHCTEIPIPEQASLLKLQGGYVKLFKGQKPQGNENAWHDILGGARTMRLPQYSRASGYYGEPTFFQ